VRQRSHDHQAGSTGFGHNLIQRSRPFKGMHVYLMASGQLARTLTQAREGAFR
jgi:hypothetical protein